MTKANTIKLFGLVDLETSTLRSSRTQLNLGKIPMRTLYAAAFAVAAVMSVGTSTASAASPILSLDPSPSCYTLYAGQTIVAGDVCVSLNGTDLVVEYATSGGWEMTGAHTWIGESADTYPQGKNGNPQIGKFPYNSGALAGLVTYTVSVPLLSVTDKFETLDQYCGTGAPVPSLFLMAHAQLRKRTATGTYQTETGWSDGTRVVDRGSWATRSLLSFKVTCPVEDPIVDEAPVYGHETAWALGDTTFASLPSCGTDGIRGTADDGLDGGNGKLATRWGWSVGPVSAGETVLQDIYAAAGGNDLTKGSLIGTAEIAYDGELVTVHILTDGDYAFTAVHTFVGSNHTCTVAPGKLGDTKTYSTPADEQTAVYAYSGIEAYLAIHFDAVGICDGNGNFCPKEE